MALNEGGFMHHRRFLWPGFFIAGAFAAATGCGSQVNVDPGGHGGQGASGSTGSSSSGTGTTAGSGGSGAGTPCGNGPGIVLAMNRLLLGDTDTNGTPNAQNGWKQYGLNLDGLTSTKDSTDLCKPAAGSSPSAVYPDGNNGIDNSFGRNILPIFLGLAPDISAQANDAIQAGDGTLMLEIEGLGAGPGNCTAVSKLYEGARLGSPPLFDGTDIWPVAPQSLQNPNDIESVKNVFLQSTIIDQFYRSGPEASFNLELVINDVTLKLPISHARFEMSLDADHARATGGMIAGIIETEALVAEIVNIAGTFDQSLCDPNSPTLQSILNQMRQASDIMKDGTQDPSATCDGISIGLGFDMRRVELGPIAPFTPPPPDPCGPTP
jgi:hypothetical protein